MDDWSMNNWPQGFARKYIRRRREESHSWENREFSLRELEFRNLFKTMIHGDWIVVDDTANPLEPIGIDEII